MVDLKEREAEQAQQRAQTEREAIKQEEAQIAKEREQPQDSQKEQELAERESELEQRRDEAQKLDELAEQKIEEAQQEREEIAKDQQSTIAATDSGSSNASTASGNQQDGTFRETVGGLFGITIENPDPSRGRLILFNLTTGNEIRRSVLNTIHTRTVTFIDGKIIAIAGENRADATVRLTEINQDTLETVKFGDDDVMTGSLIWVNSNYLYAITVDLTNNQCYLGRFDTNLVLQAKSSITVHPQASVAFQQERLLTQRDDGSALILNPVDLTEIK
jgi:hypothetical protein